MLDWMKPYPLPSAIATLPDLCFDDPAVFALDFAGHIVSGK